MNGLATIVPTNIATEILLAFPILEVGIGRVSVLFEGLQFQLLEASNTQRYPVPTHRSYPAVFVVLAFTVGT